MRDLTIQETEIVGGGISVSVGDVSALNNASAGNGNAIGSGNSVTVSDNLSGNSVDIAGTVNAAVAAVIGSAMGSLT